MSGGTSSRVPSEKTPGNGWKSHQAVALSSRRLAGSWQVHREPSGLRTGVVRRLLASGLRSWSFAGAQQSRGGLTSCQWSARLAYDGNWTGRLQVNTPESNQTSAQSFLPAL